jgi:hypothetical protein
MLMISGQSESIGDRPSSDLYTIEAGAFLRLCKMVESYASSKQARTHAYLHASIRRLSVFASDEAMSVRTPDRVAEGLRRYGYLLCARQIEVLETWLEKQGWRNRQVAV